jgi:2-succinyl-6-hydroxy-2,4-cyclohexadiene-1-carboxylate synthase
MHPVLYTGLNGKWVMWLHGFTGSKHNWEKSVYPPIAIHHKLILADIVGHGGAYTGDNQHEYTMEQAAKSVLSFAEKIEEPITLAGYSMGGRLALYIATQYPERVQSLILESASPGLKTEAEREARRKADNELADKIEANGIEWFVDYWENLPLWHMQTPEQKAKLREQRLKNDSMGLANSLRGMGTGAMPSLWDELKNLNLPVKLIAGELDTKYVEINREMAELIPNADLSIVEGAGHTVHLEKPQEYTDLVLQFLDKHS